MGFTHIWVKFTSYELVLEMFETHFTIRNFFFPEKKKEIASLHRQTVQKKQTGQFPHWPVYPTSLSGRSYYLLYCLLRTMVCTMHVIEFL